MYISYVAKEMVRQRNAEIMAEVEKYRLIAQAEEARKAERLSAGESAGQQTPSRLGRTAWTAASALLNILKVGLPAIAAWLGLRG